MIAPTRHDLTVMAEGDPSPYRDVMSFFPTLCVGCWRVQLAALADAREGNLTCVACAAPCRVVPGRSYGAEDRVGFAELSSIVSEGKLTLGEARGYGAEADRALGSGIHSPLLGRLAERIPGLMPHQIAAGKNLSAQRRVLITIKTVLDALATVTRRSADSLVAMPARRVIPS